VLFDIFLLIALMNIVLDAERVAATAEHSHQLSVKAETIFEHLSEAAVSIAANTRSRNFLGFPSRSAQVESDVESLKELARGNANEIRDAAQVQDISDRLLNLLGQDRDRIDNRGYEFPLGYNLIKQQITALLGRLKDKIAQLYPQEQPNGGETAVSSRKAIKIAIIGGFICNVIIAFTLAVYFNQGTTRRLQALMKNTNSFAKGQELAPLVGGSDEIAKLDFTFHEMVRLLRESDEKEKAARLEADRLKADFTAMVIHDVRSPLATMRMFLDLVTTDFYGTTPQGEREQADRVKRLIDRLLGLVDRVLFFERLEAGEIPIELKETGLAEIIEDAVDAVSGSASDAGIKINVESCPAHVMADRDQITRVVTNLLSNAIKYSPPNGIIQLSILEDEKTVAVRIKDEGPGIDNDQKQLIFEKYRQAQSPSVKEGSGLGLAICKGIIEQHGGSIGVSDGDKGGSVFWFKLPKQPQLLAQLS
jgi:signal transduction histidine kinase